MNCSGKSGLKLNTGSESCIPFSRSRVSFAAWPINDQTDLFAAVEIWSNSRSQNLQEAQNLGISPLSLLISLIAANYSSTGLYYFNILIQ